MPLRLGALALVMALSACGDGGTGSDMAWCNPDTRTCAGEQCGMPCDPARDTSCTDHGCFEPLVCNCFAGRWECHAGVPLCGVDMARPRDLSPSD